MRWLWQKYSPSMAVSGQRVWLSMYSKHWCSSFGALMNSFMSLSSSIGTPYPPRGGLWKCGLNRKARRDAPGLSLSLTYYFQYTGWTITHLLSIFFVVSGLG
jgi:hypothetical protein